MRSRVVDQEEIRKLFNEGRYYERMQAGEFRAQIIRQVLVRRGDRRIRNAFSQTVQYWDRFGNLVAVVHQYRKRDGSLGASGRPDPKFLRHEDVIYRPGLVEDWDPLE
jgi:hypothetical protein